MPVSGVQSADACAAVTCGEGGIYECAAITCAEALLYA